MHTNQKNQTRQRVNSSLLAAGLALGLGAGIAKADVVPYTADANTLHLYHLDESAANIIDYGNGYGGVKINLWPNNVPSLGAATYTGFGTSLNDAQSLSVLTSGAAIGAGPGSGTTPVTYNNTQFQGADGSFTYEVYVKLNQISTLPYGGNSQAMILGHDGGNGNRNWDLKQYGANNIMFASNPDVGTDQVSFIIPTTGANAWDANSWFHLAVTFDGPTKEAKMYWTKVTPTVSGANLMVTKTLLDAPMTGTTYFTIGASARAWPQRFIDGCIDEVRISDIVRAPADMIPLASSSGAYGTWAITNANAPSGTPADDYDGDGVSNALEFVLGGTKTSNDLSRLPTITPDATNLIFTFKQYHQSKSAGTTVAIEVGTTLAAWPNTYSVYPTVDSAVTVVDNLDGTDTVTLSLLKTPDAQKFARLKVTIAN